MSTCEDLGVRAWKGLKRGKISIFAGAQGYVGSTGKKDWLTGLGWGRQRTSGFAPIHAPIETTVCFAT